MINILITGSDGQLGSEIKTIAPGYNNMNFIYTDIGTLDITNPSSVDDFLADGDFSYVINCAAYTQVDKAETDFHNAELLNVIAVRNLARSCLKHNTRLIHFSTDYVFDGRTPTPYTESSVTNPLSVYGLTKLNGEKEALAYSQGMVIRTSWLYSQYGSNFVKSIIRLGLEKKSLNIVYDQIGCPTWAHDLAKAVIAIISVCETGKIEFTNEIFNYTNLGLCSWYDFACEIIKLSVINCKITPIESKDYPAPAPRPGYSVLNKDKIIKKFNLEIPYWKESLEKCIYNIKHNS